MIAGFSLALIVAGSVLLYLGYTGAAPGSPSPTTTPKPSAPTLSIGRGYNYTLALTVGSVLTYNSTYMTSEGMPAQSTLYTVSVTGIQWPFIQGVYSILGQNNTGPARIGVGNMALPLELLGAHTAGLPMIVPAIGSGTCATLTLTGQGSLEANGYAYEAYLYSMNISTGNYTVTASLAYRKSDGILVDANYTVYGGGRALFMNRQVLVNATLGGESTIETPGDWVCSQPLSSDLRFTLEGSYVLQNATLTPVNLTLIREASLKTGLVGIVVKDGQQVTMDFWKTLLEASVECPQARVYLIILGPLSDQTSISLAGNIVERAAASEETLIVRFISGVPDGKLYRYASLGDVVNQLCGSR